jgi:sulfur-oxidizing protein SoxB
MVDACKLLGVDVMTGHWEFTYGAERVQQIVDRTSPARSTSSRTTWKRADFGDPVFKPYVLREINGVPLAIIGQAFPYTPIANPAHFIPDWTFGIQEEHLQKMIDQARGEGAQVVVLLSHNGMDVDLKLASRVRGLDAILGGHTHDGVPTTGQVAQRRRQYAGHQRRQQRQVPRRARFRRARRQGRRLALSLAAGVRRCCCRRTRRWLR